MLFRSGFTGGLVDVPLTFQKLTENEKTLRIRFGKNRKSLFQQNGSDNFLPQWLCGFTFSYLSTGWAPQARSETPKKQLKRSRARRARPRWRPRPMSWLRTWKGLPLKAMAWVRTAIAQQLPTCQCVPIWNPLIVTIVAKTLREPALVPPMCHQRTRLDLRVPRACAAAGPTRARQRQLRTKRA